MEIIKDLRPTSYLNRDFGGYFLSLNPIPSYSITLDSEIDQVFPNDDQYSFQHVKLFSLHNHLFYDPWYKNSVFVVDKKWKVKKIEVNASTNNLKKIIEVWEIPSHHSRVPGHYPVTLSFPSPNLIVISDGAGTIHVVSRESKWELLYSEEIIGKEKSFVIADSRWVFDGFLCGLHVLVMYLESSNESSSEEKETSKIITRLEWIELIKEPSKSWNLNSIRQLKGKELPDYIAFEPGCKGIFVASENLFCFISDTENPIVLETNFQKEKKKKNITYMWQQNPEDIKLWLSLDEGTSNKDIKVSVEDLIFSLHCKNNLILQGILFQNIDHDLTTWTLEENRLNVVFQKLECGLMWKEFLIGNGEGEEILDGSIVQITHERLAHLCSDQKVKDKELFGSSPAFNMDQLEECDNFGEHKILYRLDGTSHKITHQYSLAGHQYLFNVKLNAELAPALCLRHDLQGILWQPEKVEDMTDWECTQIYTFPAFGYVLASKQNRKFALCSTNTSFTVICDAQKNIYIYYKDKNNDLRNRTSNGHVKAPVGKLNVITLESEDSILGVLADGNNIFVLLKDKIYQYDVTCVSLSCND